jgi:putative ABC transport system permease protein
MNALDCLRSALQSLRINVLRSALTTLGIVIGVGAVIAMVAIGAGAQARVSALISSLGTNILMVTPGFVDSGGVRLGAGSRPALTLDDADAIQNEIGAVQAVAPVVRGSGQIVLGNGNWATTINGITSDYFETRDWFAESGREFTPEDINGSAKVVVLGATVAERIFGDGDPVGQIVRLQNVPLEVIGVLARKGESPWGGDQDDIVFIPVTTAKKRVLGERQLRGNLVNSIMVKVRSADLIPEAQSGIRDLLRQRHRLRSDRADDFNLRNMSDALQTRAESSRVMTLLLASIASVSLLVGGIGIMNIMLVSVTERTREIGLRMAIGARGRDVLAQFVTEAVVLSSLGGMVGVSVGVSASMIIASVAGWPMLIEVKSILFAVLFSAAIGVFFGFYPARRAARLDPIEALRYE